MDQTEFNILHFPSLDSTNTYAINNIADLPHHSVILSDIQTAGRGRMARPWISDTNENLYVSVVIRPELDYKKLPLSNFTQLFSVAVAKAISSYDICPQIKWPNDILIHKKKVCGILSEVSFSGSIFKGLVVGIGLNVNKNADGKVDADYLTTSLQDETGNFMDKKEVLDRIFQAYLNSYEGFITEGFPYIYNTYMEFFPFIGEDVSIINSNHNVSGKIQKITETGELVIDDVTGKIHKITLGDIIWKY